MLLVCFEMMCSRIYHLMQPLKNVTFCTHTKKNSHYMLNYHVACLALPRLEMCMWHATDITLYGALIPVSWCIRFNLCNNITPHMMVLLKCAE